VEIGPVGAGAPGGVRMPWARKGVGFRMSAVTAEAIQDVRKNLRDDDLIFIDRLFWFVVRYSEFLTAYCICW
jgi:predicted ATPase